MVRQGAGSRRARGFVCPGRDGPVGLRVALFAEGIWGEELRVASDEFRVGLTFIFGDPVRC